MNTRDETEQLIKELSISRTHFHEVSKISYQRISKKITDCFVDQRYRTIHWANMGHYKKELPVQFVDISKDKFWYHRLEKIFSPDMTVYFMLEDTKAYRPKYWLYEARIHELIMLLDKAFFYDFYIVSKKFQWLFSENHEEVLSIVGKIKFPCC